MPGNVKDKKEREEEETNGSEAEYLVDDLDERIEGSSGSRLQLLKSQLRFVLFRRRSSYNSHHGFVISPDSRYALTLINCLFVLLKFHNLKLCFVSFFVLLDWILRRLVFFFRCFCLLVFIFSSSLRFSY
jgi:hypothetical protein